MNLVKYISSLVPALVLAAFVSCGDDSDGGTDNQGSDDIKITGVKVTAFTASVTGTFQGLGKSDVALGKHGVLYCPKSDKTDAIFKSWQDGNDTPECSVYENKKGFNGESFSGTIEGLYPETEYSFCLFSQGQDGKRKISSASTFTTARFNPEFGEFKFTQINFIDAIATVSLSIDDADAKCCSIGVMLSDGQNADIQNAIKVTYHEGVYEPRLQIVTQGLQLDHSYYSRVVIKYAAANGKDGYVYGPETTLTAKASDELAVDLNLPSGIKWARYDLGQNKLTAVNVKGFRWGSMVLVNYSSDVYNDEKNRRVYEYWDASSRSYTNIGSEISGTDYDVAHVLLGGKWRMPTKADVQELIDNCDVSSFSSITESAYTEYGNIYVNEWILGNVIGSNNAKIQLVMSSSQIFDGYWTASSEDDIPLSFCWLARNKANSSSSGEIENKVPGSGHISITTKIVRERPLYIRPVWDPNMPD